MGSGVEVVHVAYARQQRARHSNNGSHIRATLKPVGKLLPPGGQTSGQSAHDPRAIFKHNNRGQVVLNFGATLKNVGLNVGQLMRMKTKLGTLENSLKHSLHAKRTHQRRRAQLGEGRAAR